MNKSMSLDGKLLDLDNIEIIKKQIKDIHDKVDLLSSDIEELNKLTSIISDALDKKSNTKVLLQG
jgi:archaellum component FlaC